MISFSNPIPINDMLNNTSPVLVEMNDISTNNNVTMTQPSVKNNKVVIENVDVKVLNATCTVTITGRIGYDSTYLDVSISVTEATCDAAISRAVQALHVLANEL